MTYDELVSRLQDYVEDTGGSFSDNVDTIIRQAEDRIYKSAQLPATRAYASGTLTAGIDTWTFPTDCLGIHEAYVTNNSTKLFLLPKDVSFLIEAYPVTTTRGVPRYYAIRNETDIMLAPPPASNYAISIGYLKKPESIITSGTSWLGNNAEACLLASCVYEAYIFLKGEPELMKTYEAKFKEELARLKVIAEGRYQRDSFRNGELRIGVN